MALALARGVESFAAVLGPVPALAALPGPGTSASALGSSALGLDTSAPALRSFVLGPGTAPSPMTAAKALDKSLFRPPAAEAAGTFPSLPTAAEALDKFLPFQAEGDLLRSLSYDSSLTSA